MKILKGKNITTEIIEQALNLDWSCYPREYWLTLDKCKDYFSVNNDIYIALVDGDELIGYINFSPITDEAYDKIRSGSCNDTCLDGDDIVPFDKRGLYNGYFSSIVVKSEYRNKNYAALLMNEFFKHLTELAEKGIVFSRIVADVLSDGGRRLLEKFGMTKVNDRITYSNIYEVQLFQDNANLTGQAKELSEIYKRMNING
ncbi:MAG: GNAT family N-acetyltransferase [Clostridia bacterium]|nr:GNAT family N-acetyltransferase [Clostridia bacterium]